MWFRRRDKGEESAAALKDAKQNLRIVQKRGPEVSRVADALKDMRERNHFGEALQEIIVRKRGPLT